MPRVHLAVVALTVALLAFIPAAPASASPQPLWPCVAPVWIEDGARLPRYAHGALRQFDAATVISWPVVEDPADAMVTIDWADMRTEGYGGLAIIWRDRDEILVVRDRAVLSVETHDEILLENRQRCQIIPYSLGI